MASHIDSNIFVVVDFLNIILCLPWQPIVQQFQLECPLYVASIEIKFV